MRSGRCPWLGAAVLRSRRPRTPAASRRVHPTAPGRRGAIRSLTRPRPRSCGCAPSGRRRPPWPRPRDLAMYGRALARRSNATPPTGRARCEGQAPPALDHGGCDPDGHVRATGLPAACRDMRPTWGSIERARLHGFSPTRSTLGAGRSWPRRATPVSRARHGAPATPSGQINRRGGPRASPSCLHPAAGAPRGHYCPGSRPESRRHSRRRSLPPPSSPSPSARRHWGAGRGRAGAGRPRGGRHPPGRGGRAHGADGAAVGAARTGRRGGRDARRADRGHLLLAR